ncbi:arsenical resistance protein ArsH [Pseudoalteromonas luteoviolacea]|uniref:arsenical resistance protein ArsH n=1 Tax=Pseudoalteromonas luteoviolacea TaxID=43657 RepID=UPI0009B86748|nr:arsenical resistance protein ArsH [Pseudoalteromonas luteoviolacea]
MHYLKAHSFDLLYPTNVLNTQKPKVLILYGSLRPNSISKKAAIEAGNILTYMGAKVKYFDPQDLPLFDHGANSEHPKVKELRDLVTWSEAQVWSSPELHGNMSAVLKNQIDWIPLSIGAVRPTQGKVLAVMQISGGSQSFNAVNNMRILGRWMRMLTIPNQSSVAKAYNEFNDDGTMKPSSYRDRMVDVMEELMRFTYLTRDHKSFLVDRYSERKAPVKQQAKLSSAMADIVESKTPSENKQVSCC